MSSVVLGIIAETFVNLNAIEQTQEWRQPHASMAWNRHAIAQTLLLKHFASMAWGARNLISTQAST